MPHVRIGRVRIGDTPRLVAALTAPDQPAQFAAAKAAGADLVELRLDYLSHLPEARIVETVKRAAKSCALPIIATIRASREGGASREGVAADDKRREGLFAMLMPHVAAVDVELSSSALGPVTSAARKAGVPAIVSYHHFSSTPAVGRLRALAQLCKARGGDIVKIVTVARTPAEHIRLLTLLQEKPSEPLAAFSMGPQALISRVMAGLFRSALLYGAVPGAGGPPPAPGIPKLADLKASLRSFGL